MGRGRVVLERIENKINRQVTFSKRRDGLLKKAYELSILCEAEIALIIFSSRGKLFEFGSHDMNSILERYRQCCYTQRDNNVVDEDTQTICHEVSRLKAKYESLQHSQRQFLGEDIASLNLKELQNLEKQLDKTLSQARLRKMQILIQRLEELRKKEHDLGEMNSQLKSKLEEGQQSHGVQGHGQPSNAVIQSQASHIGLGCWESQTQENGGEGRIREKGKASNWDGWMGGLIIAEKLDEIVNKNVV